MPPGFEPVTAGRHNECIVHLQRVHCSPTNRRQTNDVDSILAPAEMLMPWLGSGMKQWHLCMGFRVEAMLLDPLVAVAPGTRQAQVGLLRTATTGEGNDMLNVHLRAANFLGGLAIFTAVLRRRSNFGADGPGDVLHGLALDPTQERFSPAQTEQRIGTGFQKGHTAVVLAQGVKLLLLCRGERWGGRPPRGHSGALQPAVGARLRPVGLVPSSVLVCSA